MLDSEVLDLSQTIDRHPFTLTPDTPLSEVITLMSSRRASYVLVTQEQRLVGIFTERDVVKLTAVGRNLSGVVIADVMTRQIVTLAESETQNILNMLSLLRQHHIRHLPVVNAQNELIGIITHGSIREILQPADLLQLRRVSDVMTKEVITAPASASVFQLTQLMAEHQVSCVVIVEEDKLPNLYPVGIVTERDIVQLQAMKVDFTQVRADKVMSTPMLPSQPTETLWSAHQKMRQYRIRRVVVVGNAGELVGILTQSSLLSVLNPIEMLAALETLQQVVQERTTELQLANEQLQNEIIERQRAEAKLQEFASILQKTNDELENLVAERTSTLRSTLEQLQIEVAQRKRSEAELVKALQKEQELSELKSRFVTVASHEFRTPLSTILVSSDLLKSFGHKIDEVQRIKKLDKIQTAVQQLTSLLDDILLIGKNTSGIVEFLPKEINIQSVFQEIVEEIGLTQGHLHSLNFDCKGEFFRVEMDEKLLRQMLMNLLSNAIKYSPQGESIHITLICENGQVVFIVKDRGIGIPLPDRERLFEIFHRGSNVGTISGTGLGMVIVKNAVEAHGGMITVESELDRGTTFTVCIPTRQVRGNIKCVSPGGSTNHSLVDAIISN